MTNGTIEGIVENGQIRLLENIRLPENTRVYVVIAENKESRPRACTARGSRIPSKRGDFVKQVFEESTDAQV